MTDRPMTPELKAALDALTEANRRHLKILAGVPEHDFLAALLTGLVAEVALMERREVVERMHEISLLHALEADARADVDKAAEGAVWPTEPEDRSKGVAWHPWAVPDTLEGLDTPCP
jgi:hypothetical protein